MQKDVEELEDVTDCRDLRREVETKYIHSLSSRGAGTTIANGVYVRNTSVVQRMTGSRECGKELASWRIGSVNSIEGVVIDPLFRRWNWIGIAWEGKEALDSSCVSFSPFSDGDQLQPNIQGVRLSTKRVGVRNVGALPQGRSSQPHSAD